jgi:hypothetical protein
MNGVYGKVDRQGPEPAGQCHETILLPSPHRYYFRTARDPTTITSRRPALAALVNRYLQRRLMNRYRMMASKTAHGNSAPLKLNEGGDNSSFCQNAGILAA